MTKINIGTNGYAMPMPMCIVGTHFENKPNYMALGWVTRVNYKPDLIAIGVNKAHATNAGIRECSEFSLNFPSAQMVEITDYVGLVSGKRTDKSALFETHYGELQSAPMIVDCPYTMECRLHDTMEFSHDTLFVGEIVGTWCDEDCMTENTPDIKKIDPFVLTMPDNKYWSIGDHVDDAWKAGKALKNKE